MRTYLNCWIRRCHRRIPWNNCIGFGCDNASVMVGIYTSVNTHIKKQNPNAHIIGCPCHLIHIATKQLHVDIEEALVDIFFYLHKSSKRNKEFRAFQVACGTKLHKIIKHGSTRWLSLQNCIDRLIEQWEPLQTFLHLK